MLQSNKNIIRRDVGLIRLVEELGDVKNKPPMRVLLSNN